MQQLSEEEAQTLIKLEKILLNPTAINIPPKLGKEKYELTDTKNIQEFIINSNRSRKNARKISLILLYNNNIILLRLDTGHGIHINPDNSEILGGIPHIHIYHEGFDDKWAYPLPSCFTNINNIAETLVEFFSYSNVINTNEIYVQGGLFDDRSD